MTRRRRQNADLLVITYGVHPRACHDEDRDVDVASRQGCGSCLKKGASDAKLREQMTLSSPLRYANIHSLNVIAYS